MRIARVLLGVAVGAAMALTVTSQVHRWQSERSVWMAAVQHAPHKPRPWINLGREYALEGNDALAADAYRTAIAESVGRPDGHLSIGIAAMNLTLLAMSRGDLASAAYWRTTAKAMRVTEVARWLDAPL